MEQGSQYLRPKVVVSFYVHGKHLRSCRDGQGGWSGGAMVLGKLPVPGRPTIWIIVWQRPVALAVGAV